jgi:hypothetical protein
MHLDWQKCSIDHWCSFLEIDLFHTRLNVEGVYIIWYGGLHPATVCIGRGNVRYKLISHRAQPEVLQFKEHNLFVTWAMVGEGDQDGVEQFLREHYPPLICKKMAQVRSITVNFPWK